jgi:hypothetical protein
VNVPTYTNGYIPLELMTVFDRGYNTVDGNWYHALSPATLARHRALVALGLKRTGRTLAINRGWSAYRPYAAQVLAKKIHGIYAATPGTSSHGGLWEGRQCLAMDYGNWAWVYESHGGVNSFAADCRAVGLSPLLIVKSRGYPDEFWHVIDLNPWSAVPAFDSSTPFPQEEDDMFSDQDRANLQSVMLALGAGGLTPGMWKDEDTATGAARAARDAATSVKDALAQGQTVKRVVNLDQQVTGADGFNPSLVQHALDIKATLAGGGDLRALTDVDLTAIAKAVNDEAHRRSAA